MHDISWENTGEPDIVQKARMYDVTADDPTEREYYFDPAIGKFWCKDYTVFNNGRAQWQVSIETFPFGEVRNA